MDIATMRYYYMNGLWPIARLDKLLGAGKITQAEYDEIAGAAPRVQEEPPNAAL